MRAQDEHRSGFGLRPPRRMRAERSGLTTVTRYGIGVSGWADRHDRVIAIVVVIVALGIPVIYWKLEPLISRYVTNDVTLGITAEWRHWWKGGNYQLTARCSTAEKRLYWQGTAPDNTVAREAQARAHPDCDIHGILNITPHASPGHHFYRIAFSCPRGSQPRTFHVSGLDADHAKQIAADASPDCVIESARRSCEYFMRYTRMRGRGTTGVIRKREPGCDEALERLMP